MVSVGLSYTVLNLVYKLICVLFSIYMYKYIYNVCPEQISALRVPSVPSASASEPGAVAARRWCGLAALQEEDREAILPLYDAMAEKMETWIFMGFWMGFI